MTNYNQKLIDLIKKKIGDNIKINTAVAGALNASESVLYRKINGTTPLSVDEFFKLVNYFKIDLNLFNEYPGSFLFNGNLVYNDNVSVLNYFKDTSKFLEMIEQGGGTLHNLSKDVPLFYYFFHDELGWFKIYFMLKYILLDPAYEHKKFDMNFKEEALLKIAKDIPTIINLLILLRFGI
jgi:hypothetical protein